MSSSPLLQYGVAGLSIAVIIVLGVVLYSLIRYSLQLLVQTQRLSAPMLTPLLGFIRGTVVVVVILVSLHQTGVAITSIWTVVISAAALVAGGFVALSSVASNLLCTLFLLVFVPFRIGDEIEIIDATKPGAGLRGKVIDLNPFYASLQSATPNGDQTSLVCIPNTTFFQKTIRRWQTSEMIQQTGDTASQD